MLETTSDKSVKTARPTSLTVIAWILIASSAISCVAFAASHGNTATEDMMRQSPIPVMLQYVIGYFGLAVQAACAVALLKGFRLGRTVYLYWGLIGVVFGFATSPLKMALIPGTIFYVVVLFFLFRPASLKSSELQATI